MISKISKLLFKYNDLLTNSINNHNWTNCLLYETKILFLKNRLFNYYGVCSIDFTNKVLRFE